MANCYPGLELDVRNFDRRFFPGLVFEFVARDDVDAAYSQPDRYGARLSYVETDQDPDLQKHEAAKLLADLTGDAGSRLDRAVWHLEWLEQDGNRISMRWHRDGASMPMDGLWCGGWRAASSRCPSLCASVCASVPRASPRRPSAASPTRSSSRASGARSAIPRAASSAPSTSRASCCRAGARPGSTTSTTAPATTGPRTIRTSCWARSCPASRPCRATFPQHRSRRRLLGWLRADRRRAVAASALDTIGRNRPFQLDAFQINHVWRELAVVLNDTESDGLYVPDAFPTANPFASPAEQAQELRELLAPLEMALAIEYLYARFSIIVPRTPPTGRWAGLADDAVFVRDYLMLVSASEMSHLRWAKHARLALAARRPHGRLRPTGSSP